MSTDYASGGPYEVNEETLEDMITRRIAPDGKGTPIDGIPGTEPNAARRTLTLLNLQSRQECTVRTGWGPYTFSQQSMSKPSAACYAMELLGFDQDGVRIFQQHLGNQFSGLPYNEFNFMGNGNPYNYSDNIGALKVWQLIVAKIRETDQHSDPFENFYRWFCRLTGTNTPSPSLHMAKGEYDEDGQNWRLLEGLGIQRGTREWHDVYYSYCRACATKITTLEMATVFGTLANGGTNPRTKQQVIWPHIARHVYQGMSQHGAYDESEKYLLKAGLYSKTGVDGGIMGQLRDHPGWVFCGHHSDLNGAGNSGEVLKWIVDLAAMRLEWPGSGVQTHRLPPNVPTGKALDDLLQSEMRPATLSALQVALNAHIEANKRKDDRSGIYVDKKGFDKKGFYLKLNPKNKPIEKRSALLLEATDSYGVFKQYYFMPDTHAKHKIMVQRGRRAAAGPRDPNGTLRRSPFFSG